MDVATKAVALRAIDYKENDKMVLLYSLEYGKISVHARGVRKSGAKLKYACDQFCFGLYELARAGDRFTLKTCEQLESFYSIREDIFAYYAACSAAECIVNCTEEGQSDVKIFVAFLKTLEQLSSEVDPLLVTLKFLLDFLRLQGVKPDFGRCFVCGQKTKLYLDIEKGGVLCENCRGVNSYAVSARVSNVCNLLDGLDYEKLKNVTVASVILKEALNLCNKYLSGCFSPLRSLSELLKLA